MNNVERLMHDLVELRNRIEGLTGETQEDCDSIAMATEYIDITIEELEKVTTI